MRKELIIAIISGIVIGVVVAFGFWRANSALNDESMPAEQEENITQDQQASPELTQLTIAQPQEDDVITESPVTVSGIAKADTTLIISAEDEDYIVITSPDGSFEQEVDLVGGVNDILFAHSDNDGSAQTASLRVIYSTEFEEQTTEE